MKIVVIQEARYVRGCRGKGGPVPITKYPAKVILDGVKMDSELPENQAHADYINSVFNAAAHRESGDADGCDSEGGES